MRITPVFLLACFLTCLLFGCERTETAVDLYKNVKQKTERTQEEAQKSIEKKARETLGAKEKTYEDKEDENDK